MEAESDAEGESAPLLKLEIRRQRIARYNSTTGSTTTGSASSADSIDSLREPAKRTRSVCESITLSWHNINVFGKKPKKKWCGGGSQPTTPIHILKNVTGEATPGSLLAMMGASGAGKTTLMNVLTGRNTSRLTIEGSVLINNRPAKKKIAKCSAYVQQDDLFLGTLKVKEHLMFQALLRLGKHVSYETKKQRVEEVMQEMGLMKCANTVIGVPGRVKGISGGEMKRLAFASEVLLNPALLFCDEPTSGLDSFMAQSIVSVLRDMAISGRTIICTIHQPSSEVFAMFDELLLMAEGRVAYLGKAKDALAFFSRLGHQCPTNYNPADFYIQKLAVMPGKEEDCRREVAAICNEFAKSEYAVDLAKRMEIQSDTIGVPDDMPDQPKYRATWFTQLRVLLKRSALSISREPVITTVRLFQTSAVAILLGLIFLQQDLTQEGIMNINGAMFLFLTNMTFQNLFAVMNVFCLELPIFLREHFNGMYRTDVYFLSKTLAELPVFIFLPVLFCSIIYWMVGMHNDALAFARCLLIVTLVANSACSFGYLISCLSSSVTMALSFGPPLIVPLMLFGGFFLNNKSVPVYFIWVKYLSWFYYGNEALTINQWKDIDNIECGNATSCLPSGSAILEKLNFKEENMYFDIGMLLVLLVGFRILAFLALLMKTIRRR